MAVGKQRSVLFEVIGRSVYWMSMVPVCIYIAWMYGGRCSCTYPTWTKRNGCKEQRTALWFLFRSPFVDNNGQYNILRMITCVFRERCHRSTENIILVQCDQCNIIYIKFFVPPSYGSLLPIADNTELLK